MKVEIEIKENATGKIVYGNAGDRSDPKTAAMFDAAKAKYDLATHTITETDVTQKMADKATKRASASAARAKVLNGTASLAEIRETLADMLGANA